MTNPWEVGGLTGLMEASHGLENIPFSKNWYGIHPDMIPVIFIYQFDVQQLLRKAIFRKSK